MFTRVFLRLTLFAYLFSLLFCQSLAQRVTAIDGDGDTVLATFVTDADGDTISTRILSTLTDDADDADDSASTTSSRSTATTSATTTSTTAATATTTSCQGSTCPAAPTVYTVSSQVLTWSPTSWVTPDPVYSSGSGVLSASDYFSTYNVASGFVQTSGASVSKASDQSTSNSAPHLSATVTPLVMVVTFLFCLVLF